MSIVQLSCIRLLAEIAERLGVETPACEVTVAAQGWFVGYVDISVVRTGTIIESIRCWGSPSPDYTVAREDAARVAIQRMKSELGLETKDANYDDCILFKSLYDSVTVQNADLFGQLNNLKREHNLLKDCYGSVVAEKIESIAEQVKLRRMIDECHATINRLRADQPGADTDPSEAGSAV